MESAEVGERWVEYRRGKNRPSICYWRDETLYRLPLRSWLHADMVLARLIKGKY